MTRVGKLAIVFGVVAAGLGVAGALAMRDRSVNLALTPEQWRDDVRTFAAKLPARHPDAFAVTPKVQFDQGVGDLYDAIAHGADADRIYVQLDELANGIGDAHTYVKFPADDGNLPIDVTRFGDDYRITAVGKGLEKALGARIVSINRVPVTKVRDVLLPMTPRAETDGLRERRVEAFLTIGMALHGAGITPDRNVATYGLENDASGPFTMAIHAQAPGAEITWVHAYGKPALAQTHPDETFWCETVAAQRALYCDVRLIRDLAEPGRLLLARIAAENPDRLILDLRDDGGVDYTEGQRYLVEPLRHLGNIDKRGHLFVLVGTDTFSAAMNTAALFRTGTAAILLGATIGERPNGYQEVEEMLLPNSHLTVRYSTRFYTFVSKDGENAVVPDETVVPTWAQYVAGEDPVLERALHWSAP